MSVSIKLSKIEKKNGSRYFEIREILKLLSIITHFFLNYCKPVSFAFIPKIPELKNPKRSIYFELQKKNQYLLRLNIINANWSNARLRYLDTFAFFGKWTIYYLILPLIAAGRWDRHARRARCVCIIWIIHFSVPGKERPSDTAKVALPLTQIIIARSALFRAARSVLLNERASSLLFSPVALLISLAANLRSGRRLAKCIASARAARTRAFRTLGRSIARLRHTLLLNGGCLLSRLSLALGIAVDHDSYYVSRSSVWHNRPERHRTFPAIPRQHARPVQRPDLAPRLCRSYTRVWTFMCVRACLRACVLVVRHLCHAHYTPVGMRMPVVSRWLS